MPEEQVERTEDQLRQRRKRLRLLLIPIVAFTVAAFVVNQAAPALIKHHPLVVIFFAPINRWLVLAANQVETWEFFAVAFFRLVLTDPLYFMLGRWFGDGALDWIEKQTGNSGVVPFLKKWFGRFGPAIVFVAPNNYVCLLAGASGMRVRVFLALNVVGTLARLVLIKLVGDFFEPILRPVVDFLDRYRWQVIVITVLLFTVQTMVNRKSGKKGALQSVGSMEAELEASIEAADNE